MRQKIPLHNVIISSDINVSDGGIDASVNTQDSHASILLRGNSYYQVKTGKSFKPWQEAQISKELFGKKPVAQENLGTAVLNCLETGATYVMVTMGHDLTTQQITQAKKLLANFFEKCGFAKANIEVFGITQIISQLVIHPSLCLDLNGLGDLMFQSTSSWQRNSDMTADIALGDSQEEFLFDLERNLNDEAIQHIRVVGEPGIGKTRLVLEAVLKNPKFSSDAIYIRQASDFQSSSLFNELLKQGRQYSVLLVIDECDDADRITIWRALKGRESIKLLTIDHGPEASSGSGMETLRVPLLEDDQIEEILKTYITGASHLPNWAKWCGGSARVAHAIGQNLKENPEDILKPPGSVPVWDRFISGYSAHAYDDPGRIVLRHIALFEKFGARIPVKNEADFIAKLVEQTDPSITRAKFDSVIEYYRKKRILQGDRTLRIVPAALRIHLWRDWWDNYGNSADVNSILKEMPITLYRWFIRSFAYAHSSESARDSVKQLLNPQTGILARDEFIISDAGSAFINVLAEADPKAVLTLLKAKVLNWSDEVLIGLGNARQNLAKALEKIAVWGDCYRQALKILAKLTLGENTTHSNNAQGSFLDLFRTNAPTQATFSMRMELAKELLFSNSPFERSLGLAASSRLLSREGSYRIVGIEFQGLRSEIMFWTAKEWSELTEPWTQMLSHLLVSRLKYDENWNIKVDEVLISAIEQMARTNVLHDQLISIIKELSKIPRNYTAITNLLLNRLRYPSATEPPEFTATLKNISEELVGTTFLERLRRYVLVDIWDDDYPSEDDNLDRTENIAAIRSNLANEAAQNTQEFLLALPYLFSCDSTRVEQFGFGVATALIDAQLDEEILEWTFNAPDETNYKFLCGYLRGIYNGDKVRWENLSEKLLQQRRRWIVGAVVCSGMTEKILFLTLDLYTSEVIDSQYLYPFCIARANGEVNTEFVHKVLTAILKRREPGFYETVIAIAESALCKLSQPIENEEALALELLTDQSAMSSRLSTMGEYYWDRLANRFIKQFPKSNLGFLNSLINSSTIYTGFGLAAAFPKVASTLCATSPSEAWRLISDELLGDRKDLILNWLGDLGSHARPCDPAILSFQSSDIFTWIDQDPMARSSLIVEAIYPTFEKGPAGELTKTFLEKYGHIEYVESCLISRFYSGSWTGSRSQHLTGMRDRARKWLKEAESSVVQDWLTLYIDGLNTQIEKALIGEEREF
ncbi:ATP-binding protein [Undibacterium pigrum]|uniref:Uncharacterized protein n=1 Tax=Undibacterium pigrum TaxID=401470 RepID=A0A318JEN5_9BURK|nr:ATP-binding protein [Undibacterium pigrum]PXX46967.1 hypothetical protein DFR42_101543 [Undibacterium pigrum]